MFLFLLASISSDLTVCCQRQHAGQITCIFGKTPSCRVPPSGTAPSGRKMRGFTERLKNAAEYPAYSFAFALISTTGSSSFIFLPAQMSGCFYFLSKTIYSYNITVYQLFNGRIIDLKLIGYQFQIRTKSLNIFSTKTK